MTEQEPKRAGHLGVATGPNWVLAGQSSPRGSVVCWLIETGVPVNSITLSASKTWYSCLRKSRAVGAMNLLG